jgi:predicted DNA-binding transcriptional regulator YafY
MLASRLLSILMMLQTRGRMTAVALAEECEVSVRTIYRDIDELSAAGVPVVTDRGRNGGVSLRGGYRTQLTGMTASEAETVFLAGLPGPAEELGLAKILTAARLKLAAALPAGAERIATRFHLDPAGWFYAPPVGEFLPLIARAVWSERCLRIRYARGGSPRWRKVHPLGLVLKGGYWYLVAERTASLRTYRVSAICDARVLEQGFGRPKGFDLARYWSNSSREFEKSIYNGEAELRLSPRGRDVLAILGSYVADVGERTARPADAHGWLRCTIPIEATEAGLRDLMLLGEEAEVLAPVTLRAQMAQKLRRMLTLYTRPIEEHGSAVSKVR